MRRRVVLERGFHPRAEGGVRVREPSVVRELDARGGVSELARGAHERADGGEVRGEVHARVRAGEDARAGAHLGRDARARLLGGHRVVVERGDVRDVEVQDARGRDQVGPGDVRLAEVLVPRAQHAQRHEHDERERDLEQHRRRSVRTELQRLRRAQPESTSRLALRREPRHRGRQRPRLRVVLDRGTRRRRAIAALARHRRTGRRRVRRAGLGLRGVPPPPTIETFPWCVDHFFPATLRERPVRSDERMAFAPFGARDRSRETIKRGSRR